MNGPRLPVPTLIPPTFGKAIALEGAVRELEDRFSSKASYFTRDRLLEAAETIRRVHAGELGSKDVTPAVERVLAWALNHGDPSLSSTPALLTALKWFEGMCRARSLLGLISTFLDARDVPANGLLAWTKTIHHHLKTYAGTHEDLSHWKRVADLLFAPDAAARVGKWALERPGGLKAAFLDLTPPSFRGQIKMSSPLFATALRGVMNAVALDPNFPKRLGDALELLEQATNDPALVKTASNAFLERCADQSLGEHEGLRDFCLRHFGDPRLVRNEKWLGFSEKARNLCRRWVSRGDLELFFRSVAMDDDRRRFWLLYVDQMDYSKIVLGNAAHRVGDPALQRAMDEFLKQRRHARLEDSDPTASAIIVKIRDVFIVEFSYSGDACYLYHDGEQPFDLDASVYTKSGHSRLGRRNVLKEQQSWPQSPGGNRIIHSGTWQGRAHEKLRMLGIHRQTTRAR